jgi:PTH1 family peptidyl-tRNA hydrolase
VKILVGLGNPGIRYERTRHNLGFRVINLLAAETEAGHWNTAGQSAVCTSRIAQEPVILAKPLTFMNLSGRAVRQLMNEYDAGLPEVLVILDDLDLPLGKIRVRERGSAAGHHGMESVLRALGSDEVARVRLGIGEEKVPEDKADYVLSDFPTALDEKVEEMIGRAGEAVKTIIQYDISRAMTEFNA